MKQLCAVVVTLTLLFVGAPAEAQSDSVGALDFPTSGSPEAQAHFLRGVSILHSFLDEVAQDIGALEQQRDEAGLHLDLAIASSVQKIFEFVREGRYAAKADSNRVPLDRMADSKNRVHTIGISGFSL